MKMADKPILEFVAIKRRDCGEWAIPGVIMCALVLVVEHSCVCTILEDNLTVLIVSASLKHVDAFF